jgi:hypothetical protein
MREKELQQDKKWLIGISKRVERREGETERKAVYGNK